MEEQPVTILETEYLIFGSVKSNSGKTLCVYIYSNSSGKTLGTIKWYSRWRQYCFYPEAETIWNKDCLASVDTCIKLITNMKQQERSNSNSPPVAV